MIFDWCRESDPESLHTLGIRDVELCAGVCLALCLLAEQEETVFQHRLRSRESA